MMKRIFSILLIVSLLIAMFTTTVFAGGDKVRGEIGVGSVNQVQKQDPPPFQ